METQVPTPPANADHAALKPASAGSGVPKPAEERVEVRADQPPPGQADIDGNSAPEPDAPPAAVSGGPRTSDKPERLFGLLVLLIAFGGFGVWSVLAPIDSAAVAPGVVTVESSRKTVQHIDGGFVDAIYVREGDVVSDGDLLVRLDDTEPRAQLEMARSRYLALLAEEARLIAERDGKKAINFPRELEDQTDDPRVRDAIVGQERLFENRRNSLLGEKSVLQQRIEQLEEQIIGLEALYDSTGRRTAIYEEEIDAFHKLFEKGFSDNSRLREWERLVAELEGEQSEHQSGVASAKVRITETELQVVQLQREFDTQVAERLRAVQTELADLRERVRALSKTVERTEIRAPASGSVVNLSVHTVGGIVEPRQRILDIVPQGDQLLVEAQVSPDDIDRVSPGLEAEVRFTAFNVSQTPTVPGEVLTVSGDRLEDRDTGQAYYLARIQITHDGMRQLEQRTLLPGMSAMVMINTGTRTLFGYLAKPITDRLATAFRED